MIDNQKVNDCIHACHLYFGLNKIDMTCVWLFHIFYSGTCMGRVLGFCCAMVKGKQGKFHVVDFVEKIREIYSNFFHLIIFDIIMSNIASSNSNVENISVGNVAVNTMVIVEVV